MNNNQRRNRIAINQFRKELSDMLEDIKGIDTKCLRKAVNIGLADAKENTNVGDSGNMVKFTTRKGENVEFAMNHSHVGGFMRKSWYTKRAQRSPQGIEKEMGNTADYSSYVNYGHRIVQGGVNKGFVKGQYILEKAVNKADRALEMEFKKEVERVNREHDK